MMIILNVNATKEEIIDQLSIKKSCEYSFLYRDL